MGEPRDHAFLQRGDNFIGDFLVKIVASVHKRNLMIKKPGTALPVGSRPARGVKDAEAISRYEGQ